MFLGNFVCKKYPPSPSQNLCDPFSTSSFSMYIITMTTWFTTSSTTVTVSFFHINDRSAYTFEQAPWSCSTPWNGKNTKALHTDQLT